MKILRLVLFACLLVTAPVLIAQTAAQKSFDHLKSLEGSWAGKNAQGMPVSVTFRDTAPEWVFRSKIERVGSHDSLSVH